MVISWYDTLRGSLFDKKALCVLQDVSSIAYQPAWLRMLASTTVKYGRSETAKRFFTYDFSIAILTP